MDNTIRIITDSGCDISKENEEKYKGLLEIMPFMVPIQGKSYVDRQDILAEEFYKVLKEQQEIPMHSQITAIQFEDKLRELYAQGVRTIIVDVINGAGSQTCANAQLAKQNVADELKELTVYVVDSQNYTLAYGYPVIEACKKLAAGQKYSYVVIAYYKAGGKTEYVSGGGSALMALDTTVKNIYGEVNGSNAKITWDKDTFAAKYELEYTMFDINGYAKNTTLHKASTKKNTYTI